MGRVWGGEASSRWLCRRGVCLCDSVKNVECEPPSSGLFHWNYLVCKKLPWSSEFGCPRDRLLEEWPTNSSHEKHPESRRAWLMNRHTPAGQSSNLVAVLAEAEFINELRATTTFLLSKQTWAAKHQLVASSGRLQHCPGTKIWNRTAVHPDETGYKRNDSVVFSRHLSVLTQREGTHGGVTSSGVQGVLY